MCQKVLLNGQRFVIIGISVCIHEGIFSILNILKSVIRLLRCPKLVECVNQERKTARYSSKGIYETPGRLGNWKVDVYVSECTRVRQLKFCDVKCRCVDLSL